MFSIELINKQYHCFLYNDIPYSYYVENKMLSTVKDDLQTIAEQTSNVLFKYKAYDFLWIRFKEHNAALEAFKGFANIICSSYSYKQNSRLFNRCANIYVSLKQENLDFEIKKILFKIIELGKNDDTYALYNTLEFAFEKKLLTAKEIIQPISEKLIEYELNENTNLFFDMSKLIEKVLFEKNSIKYDSKPTTIKKIANIRRKRADYYLKAANNTNDAPVWRVEHIKSAISELKGIANTDEERRNLQTKLINEQKLVFESMQTFSHSVDISHMCQESRVNISKLSNDESFYYFIFCGELLSYENACEEMIKSESGYISKYLCTETILGKNGRLKAIMPNWAETVKGKDKSLMIPHVEKFCCDRYSLSVNVGMDFIFSLIKIKDFDFDLEISKIVEFSWFIPQSRKKAFTKGLVLGFKGDFLSSISILATQIEGAIRSLALECGDSILKINANGTEEYLSLDLLLRAPKLNECVDEKLLFNIRNIFVSEYGFNIRNEIAHGLLEDEDFDNRISFYTWWFVLRLCVEFSGLKVEYAKTINDKLEQS